jgi:hypothetical protein
MDLASTRKRSASHGSLHSSFRPPGRQNSVHSPSFHKPLRSVHENNTLLPSPGPLESMLKTTTETGDIGIFTIKPVTTSSSFHHLPGTRPRFAEPNGSSTPSSLEADESSPKDDRRRLPSYRDTASEIISMYGSDSHQSWSSSLSPPIDDRGQRSYSMTAGGPRYFRCDQPLGILQGGSSISTSQRPRSPFPYPTRLKRMGVRPSSPALTENGIDYSKMVEIDRVSSVSHDA